MNFMLVVAMLVLAPAVDAAPITSDAPDLQQTLLRGKVSYCVKFLPLVINSQ